MIQEDSQLNSEQWQIVIDRNNEDIGTESEDPGD